MNRAYKFAAIAFILDGILLIIALLCDYSSMPIIAFFTGVCFANWINAKYTKRMYDCQIDEIAEILVAANLELSKYGKCVMLQLDGRYRVVDWKIPPETIITEGLEYKWIGIKKTPDFQEYLRNHVINK